MLIIVPFIIVGLSILAIKPWRNNEVEESFEEFLYRVNGPEKPRKKF